MRKATLLAPKTKNAHHLCPNKIGDYGDLVTISGFNNPGIVFLVLFSIFEKGLEGRKSMEKMGGSEGSGLERELVGNRRPFGSV